LMRALGLNYSSDETNNSYMRRENFFAFREERPASRSRRLNMRRPLMNYSIESDYDPEGR
jgi:hypothetical protein